MDQNSTHSPRATILWLDLEMTGLDANRDLILEVAAIATDWDFKEIATLQGIVKHDNGQLAELMAGNGAFWDANPAARDGLLAQNPKGSVITEVEAALIDFLDTNFPPGPVLLAGNSIHMDRRFITAQMPAFDARLNYRMLDVSAWKVVFEAKFKKRFTKPERHRALDDIRGSIEELEYYLRKVRV